MLNSCTLRGRLVKDPELRHTAAGVPVCSFSIAVERDKRNENGERITDFIDCVSWRAAAETIVQYFKKGMPIIVSGRLQFRGWVDNDGNNRKAPEIVTEKFYFAGEKKNKENNNEQTLEPEIREIEDDNDLPF